MSAIGISFNIVLKNGDYVHDGHGDDVFLFVQISFVTIEQTVTCLLVCDGLILPQQRATPKIQGTFIGRYNAFRITLYYFKARSITYRQDRFMELS